MSDWRDRLQHHDDRAAWLEARRSFIGASEWAAILGVDGAYRSAFEVWADKTGATPIEQEVPEFVEWGNILEPIVAEEFGRRIEKPVTRYDNATITATDFPFLGCSPDAHVGERAKAGGEIKVANAFKRNEWYEGVPLPYYCQVQACMFVTGLTTWWIACLIGGNELVHAQVEYDAEFCGLAIPKLEEFWHRVQANEPPTPGPGDRTRKAIVSIYPQDAGTQALLDPRHSLLVEQLIEAEDRLKSAKTTIDGIKNITRLAMGAHAFAVFPGLGKFTNKTTKAGARVLRFTREK